MTPKIGELWFVSVNGFDKRVLRQIFRVDGNKMTLIDGNRLNDMLKKNNLQGVPVIRART